MAIASTSVMCNSFKTEILSGSHAFTTTTANGSGYKIALFTSAATRNGTADLDENTTSYSTCTGEVASAAYYTTGGVQLTIVATPTLTGSTAYIDFDDVSWSAASITARGALIYKVSDGKAVAVLNFGGDKTSSASNFTVQFPAPGGTAILRIA